MSQGQLLDFAKHVKERRLFRSVQARLLRRDGPRPTIYALHRCRGAICMQCREFHVRVVDLSNPETYRSLDLRPQQPVSMPRLVGNA